MRTSTAVATLALAMALALGAVSLAAQAPAVARRGEGPAARSRLWPRERISLDDGWRFRKGDPPGHTASLLYDVRPEVDASTKAQPAAAAKAAPVVLKPWILPTGNPFIADPARRYVRPPGNPGGDVACVKPDFDDRSWQRVTWATDSVRTAGPPAALRLTPDRSLIRADGRDLAFVTVRVVDAQGVLAPRAADSLRFRIEGPGEIVATDNGDPTSFEPFQAPAHRAFNVLCLVVVRARAGQAGTIRLTASGAGLRASVTTIAAAGGRH